MKRKLKDQTTVRRQRRNVFRVGGGGGEQDRCTEKLERRPRPFASAMRLDIHGWFCNHRSTQG